MNAILTPGVGAAAWALAVAGLRFAMTLVTITSSVLTIVPPERSGMAASTVNTFRALKTAADDTGGGQGQSRPPR